MIAMVALARKASDEAHSHLIKSTEILRKTVGGAILADSLALLGYADLALDRSTEAEQHLTEALHLAVEGRLWLPLLRIMPGLALLLSDAGQIERAVELYALASRELHVANSRWFEDVVGRHIASASTALSSEVVDAAKARGRARDLWATAEELLAELVKT
jgi:hypothetical protein